MPSLLDIVPLSRKVQLGGGQEFEFFGLTARDIAGLVRRFPALGPMFGGVAPDADAPSMVDSFPDAAAAAIAASAHMTEPEDEEAVARWSGADQAVVLAVVAELSLPASIAGPFVRALAGEPGSLASDNGSRELDTGSL